MEENYLVNYPTLEDYDKDEFVIEGTVLKEYKGKSSEVRIPMGVTEVEEMRNVIFDRDWVTSLIIPQSVRMINFGYIADFKYNNLESITVLPGNKIYHEDGNCLIRARTKTLVLGCKNSIIPSDGSVTHIGDNAFNGCVALDNIALPEGITHIGKSAFASCGFKNIVLPNSLMIIDDKAFRYCLKIENLIIPCNVTRIGCCAFAMCYFLRSISISKSVTIIDGARVFSDSVKLKSITVEEGNPRYHSTNNCLIETATKKLVVGCQTSKIPDDGSVTIIGEEAFFYGGDRDLVIPLSIIKIEDNAFESCGDETDLYYQGTKEQWSLIEKGWSCMPRGCGYCTIHCVDGNIEPK